MNTKSRELLLQQILRAGNRLASYRTGFFFYGCRRRFHHYTCVTLEDVGVSRRITEVYFDVMYRTGNRHADAASSAASRFSRLNPTEPFVSDVSDAQQIMLAWFYEMVRSKEFDRFLA